MRLLEQHNPDVSFDWERLLKAGSSGPTGSTGSSGSVGSGSGSRDERRRERRDQRRQRGPEPPNAVAVSAPPPPPPAQSAAAEFASAPGERLDARNTAAPSQVFGEPEPEPQPEPRTTEPDEPVEPAPAEPVETRYARLGADGLRRLRARYADLKGRIDAKPMDEAERGELSARLERLNPDAWGSDEDVARGIDEYEIVFESFRGVVGRPPRRRRL